MELAATNPLAGIGAAVLVLAVLIVLAVVILVQVCITWLVSKFVLPSNGTFWNALRYFGWQLLVGIGMLVVLCLFAVASFFCAKSGSVIGLQAGFLLLFAFFTIFSGVSFWIPMHVYEISIWRALAFRITVMAVGFCLTLGINQLQEKYNPAYAEMRRVQEKQLRDLFDQISRQKIAPVNNQSGDVATPAPSPRPATPKPALTPARPSSELALTLPVDFPVMVNGTNLGSVTLQPGTRVKLISVEGGQLRVRYNNSEATIPAASTDYDPTHNAP